MRVDTYRLIQDCVEGGVSYGWRRAHKHTDDPGEDAILQAIEDGVMQEICEFFLFNNSRDELFDSMTESMGELLDLAAGRVTGEQNKLGVVNRARVLKYMAEAEDA